MRLMEIIKSAQSHTGKMRIFYCKKLFNMFRKFIIKHLVIYSPYTENEKTCDFATGLTLDFFDIIENKINNFKPKMKYNGGELEEHLWCYFQSAADSLVDRTLIHLCLNAEIESLRKAAGDTIKKKYKSLIEELISKNVHNVNNRAMKRWDAWELEEYWKKETRRLVSQFYNKKFTRIISSFKNDNSTAIFSHYVVKAVKNFLIDYRRGENVKMMRRMILYKDNLPGQLFETLKTIKGYGNLFYHKKRQDCLSIRDAGKALAVINDLNIPEWQLRDVKWNFMKSRKRAEYQRTIDKIRTCINDKCRNKKCKNRLTPKMFKVLINISDVVMRNRLSITENDIIVSSERLKRCVACLNIDRLKIY